MINKLQKKSMPPFYKMKITYYPEQIEGMQFKINGEHSLECIQKFNEENPKKNKLIYKYEEYERKCFEEFNKQEKYKRSDFIELAYKVMNDNKYNLKLNESKIKNMISKWKNLTQRLTKYLFLQETQTFDGNNLLQKYVYKIVTYNNQRLKLEYFIWGNDFFVNRCRLSSNIFIDGTFHIPPKFTQLLIIMYYDKQIQRKIPVFFILMNSKTEIAYDHIFSDIKDILSFDNNEKFNFSTITTDNELALNNSIRKHFPSSQRISCFFHYRQCIERNVRKFGLNKSELSDNTRIIIDILGTLPLKYDGDLDKITNIIEELKEKYPSHFILLDYFIKENLCYFIDHSLYYSKYPKFIRSNSILENYNKYLKEKLGSKKIVNYINFLSFIKGEDERFFKEFNIKSRNYAEILKFRKKSYLDTGAKDVNTNNNKYNSNDILMKDATSIINNESANWLKWLNNSCRFDVITTIYLYLYYTYNEVNKQFTDNEGI